MYNVPNCNVKTRHVCYYYYYAIIINNIIIYIKKLKLIKMYYKIDKLGTRGGLFEPLLSIEIVEIRKL